MNLGKNNSTHNTPAPPASTLKVTLLWKKQVFSIKIQNHLIRTRALKTTPSSCGESFPVGWGSTRDQPFPGSMTRRKNRKEKRAQQRKVPPGGGEWQREWLSVYLFNPSTLFCSRKCVRSAVGWKPWCPDDRREALHTWAIQSYKGTEDP